MASNFPSSLDSFTNPSSSDAMDSVSVPHASQHSDLNDAVEALQAKVGADSSAVTTSHDYKIAALEGQGTWTAYTPTWTALTVGNGTQAFYYSVVNGIMFIEGRLILGSTSAVATNPAFSIPSGYEIAYGGFPAVGHVNIRDTGTAEYIGQVKSNGTGGTSLLLKVVGAAGSYGNVTPITVSIPMGWAATDEILVNVAIGVTAV